METAAPSDALPATIVPRWEWRTFGASFGAADERLAALVPDRVEESDERYLLALRSDASVKVRGGRWTSSSSSACTTTGSSSGGPS